MESPLRANSPAVIETFRWDGVAFARLPAHLARARATCARLGLPFNKPAIHAALANAPAGQPARTRLLIAPDGPSVSFAEMPAVATEWRVALHPTPLSAADPWLQMKTTQRPVYDAARAALPAGIDEYLFLNERGELCEGTITNLFIRRDGTLLTPARHCGLLPGILRAELLAEGQAVEAVLHLHDLTNANIFLGNALRGLVPARLSIP